MFFYEHIGHMQFSILTLQTYVALLQMTKGQVNVFVPWNAVKDIIVAQGFSPKLADSELDRFCYGFECIDNYDGQVRLIALTQTGKHFLDHLILESQYQASQIAVLLRPAKRKQSLNVVLQESTFWLPRIYELVKQYKFRSGPARDYLKCLQFDQLYKFLQQACQETLVAEKGVASLDTCLSQVETQGKYWASVQSKYSWYVFAQKFELPFSDTDWQAYDLLVKTMIRPTEWGGGNDIPYSELIDVLDSEKQLTRFRDLGIIRPLWDNQKKVLESSSYRMTSPGYLMWERHKKGFIMELRIRKINHDLFQVAVCNASDFPQKVFEDLQFETHNNYLPSLTKEVKATDLTQIFTELIEGQRILKI